MRIYELLIQKLVGAILILLGAIIIILSEDSTVSVVLFVIGIYFIIKKDVMHELFEEFE